ncbi:MAG: extracellular solute-binding protein [Burkholderiaceae bacterium]
MNAKTTLIATMLWAALVSSAMAQGRPLHLLTWADYVPNEVRTQFEKESGYKVEVTVANSNDEISAKLRAADGPRFDLVQPALDRVPGAQGDFKLYRPLDLTRVKTERFIPAILAATWKNASLDGKLYALPHIWGTEGIAVNTAMGKIADYPDLCRPAFKAKIAMRLQRSTLLAFAFSTHKDPFALYNDPKAYAVLMNDVSRTLVACKANMVFWDSRSELLELLRSGRVAAGMIWDTGGWQINRDKPAIQFTVPRSGALGWIDTFTIPVKGENDDAAYAWINFNLRPDIAAKVATATGNMTAVQGTLPLQDVGIQQQFTASFPGLDLRNVKWYPAMPDGLEGIEARALHRIRAAD